MSVDSPEFRSVDFHFDPMCPFAYQTSVWIRRVREDLGVTVNWRFFSLEWVNHVEGKKFPWQRDWSYGWSLMRIGALLRRRDMADLDRWYAAIGAELHENGGSPHRPEVARRLLADLGLGADTLDEALADPSTHDDIRREHTRVTDAGGFGVPTLFFDERQCLFGPVLVDPPTGAGPVAGGDRNGGDAGGFRVAAPQVRRRCRPDRRAAAPLCARAGLDQRRSRTGDRPRRRGERRP